MKSERHPTQEELLVGAIRTIEEVLLPELRSTWARSSAMGLLGQLRYARARAASDSLAVQDRDLADCLDGLCEEFAELREAASTIEASGDASWDLRERAGRLLVLALSDESPASTAVRERLRPLLTEHVAQDLEEGHAMLQAFLASNSLGSTGSPD